MCIFMQGGDWADDGVLLYQPHSGSVACMAFSCARPTHLLSCSFDGSLRCMDVEKAVFDDVSALCPCFEFIFFYLYTLSVHIQTIGHQQLTSVCFHLVIGVCLWQCPQNVWLHVTWLLNTCGWEYPRWLCHRGQTHPRVTCPHFNGLLSVLSDTVCVKGCTSLNIQELARVPPLSQTHDSALH